LCGYRESKINRAKFYSAGDYQKPYSNTIKIGWWDKKSPGFHRGFAVAPHARTPGRL